MTLKWAKYLDKYYLSTQKKTLKGILKNDTASEELEHYLHWVNSFVINDMTEWKINLLKITLIAFIQCEFNNLKF
jgi:hypothetical protein